MSLGANGIGEPFCRFARTVFHSGTEIVLALLVLACTFVSDVMLTRTDAPGAAAVELNCSRSAAPTAVPLALSELPPAVPPLPTDARRALKIGRGEGCRGPSAAQIPRGGRPVLPRRAAVREATGFASASGDACRHLGRRMAEQFDAVVKGKAAEPWVWTVGDQTYGDTLADWQVQMRGVAFGEKFFGTADLQRAFGFGFRESNFLFHPFLRRRSMYPVTRLTIDVAGWASLQHVAPDLSSSREYFELPPDAPREHAAFALSEMPEAAASKLLLVSAPAGGAQASCGGVAKRLRTCRPSATSVMNATDMC
uniref:Uncharacterized protein n=1 Tax=Alexandrium monilatum TaxID=311494 RepID=A0A7S4UUU3_9DINO